MQNSPARLPDVGLGPRVGLPGRRQPAGYGTSWSVLVSSTSGRSGPSNRIYFTIFHPRTWGAEMTSIVLSVSRVSGATLPSAARGRGDDFYCIISRDLQLWRQD